MSADWAKEQLATVCGTDPIQVPGMDYLEAKTTTNIFIIDEEGTRLQ